MAKKLVPKILKKVTYSTGKSHFSLNKANYFFSKSTQQSTKKDVAQALNKRESNKRESISNAVLFLFGVALQQSPSDHKLFQLENLIAFLLAAKANAKMLNLALIYYGEHGFHQLMMNREFKGGNNALHVAVQYNTAEAIKNLVKILGDDVSSNLAVQLNNKGCLPYDELDENRANYDHASNTIFAVTKSPSKAKLSDVINVNIEHIEHELGEECSRQLKLALKALNYARTVIKKSYTYSVSHHPTETEIYELNALQKDIEKIRKEVDVLNKTEKNNDMEYQLIAKQAIKSAIGNCSEMACVVQYYLKSTLDASIPCEIFSIENGDHVFNVIARPPNSDPRNPKTWGNAIIVDSWNGDMFFAHQAVTRLKSFKSIFHKESISFFVAPYNPNYHHIDIGIKRLDPDNSRSLKNRK